MDTVLEAITGRKEYEFPISRDYVNHWDTRAGVREIIQNALDSESPFEFRFKTNDAGLNDLYVISRLSKLEPRSLLLGGGTKREATDKIGSFGEGYKLAMMVLTREGHSPVVLNGPKRWTCDFVHSKRYESEIFTIFEDKGDLYNEGLTFIVHDLHDVERVEIVASCLRMQHEIEGEIINTGYGQILPGYPGKLFVGDLYVCDTDLECGYNAKPEHLKLDRDRSTVDGFDLKWLTKQMWFQAGRPDTVAEMIERQSPDLVYASHGCPELVKEACYKLFQSKHPGAIVAKNQEELEDLVERGLTAYIVSNESMYSAVTTSSTYRTSGRATIAAPPKPEQILADWFEKNRKYMRTPAIVSMKEILREKAVKWRP